MSFLFFCQNNVLIFFRQQIPQISRFPCGVLKQYNPCNHVDKIKSTDYRQQTTDYHPDGTVVR